ncbi:putative pectinesterase/pectinesterase inhibitor 12 [Vitis vinifera]|uniref:Putative pectinesterase/pectinesterase inhibitor 12 n=1 Tax=Vitis vinifera TaxID=29760 RepID=A0A438CZL8_VITVI|nr:putative pectinesterase/pectinesterase inhibitor 12 [Vitis vinifera]
MATVPLPIFFFSGASALNYSNASYTSLKSVTSFCKSTPYPDTAISEAGKVSTLLSTAGQHSDVIEKQRGTIQDCRELHQITVSSLQRSVSRVRSGTPETERCESLSQRIPHNKVTCLEGLDSAAGPSKPTLVNSIVAAYKHSSGDEYDPSEVLTVAADGTGNFTTVTDAINFAPNNSNDRIIIYVREGVYEENVDIPSHKTNIVFLGDGSDVTFITGSRSVVDGWTTFRSATVAVSGEGFLARDITFENRAGPEKHQAVALRINADLAAVYKCTILGLQHCSQNANGWPIHCCNSTIRDTPDEDTGISIQNCSISATDDLYSNRGSVKSYLGRPWKVYARTVYLESYIDDFIDPSGWTEWNGNEGLDTLYYGEYDNNGPGQGQRIELLGKGIM